VNLRTFKQRSDIKEIARPENKNSIRVAQF
jgi:hypothetical protein